MSHTGRSKSSPPLQDYQPQSRYRPRARLKPGEAFSAGFYGGLGFWLSGLVFYVIGLVVSVMIIAALGGLGVILGRGG